MQVRPTILGVFKPIPELSRSKGGSAYAAHLRGTQMKILAYSVLLIFGLIGNQVALSSDPIELESEFDSNEVKWIKEAGDSSISGEAFLKLKDGTFKDCSGFSVELLPVAKYSNERIFRTYGNNDHGQVLLEDSPPKFTPDAKEYHEMVIKSACNVRNEFSFSNVASGAYYVIAFIIWNVNEKDGASKSGGAVMKRIHVKSNSENRVQLRM